MTYWHWLAIAMTLAASIFIVYDARRDRRMARELREALARGEYLRHAAQAKWDREYLDRKALSIRLRRNNRS